MTHFAPSIAQPIEHDHKQALAAVLARVTQAVTRRGAGPSPVLIGVGKRHPLSAIATLHRAGLQDFGENYAQEFRDKRAAQIGADSGLVAVRWHFIGALQRNKVKYVVGNALIHTVDSSALLTAIDKRAAHCEVLQEVLVEVQLAPEDGKAGIAPVALPTILDQFAACTHTRCVGLMTIPPPSDEPEKTRHWFRQLRQLRDQHAATERANVSLRELSMGMSADFEVAIEEGATMVRVGTALFGPRLR